MPDSNLQKADIHKDHVYRPVTLRSIAIGLLLLPINVYWMSVAELKYDSQATALPLFIYPVFLLFLLTLVNLGIHRLWKKAALQQGELLTIYVMLVISTSLAAYGMMQDLFAVILHPYQFATPENDWEALFFRYIPSWLTLSDHRVIDTYYEGDSTLYMQTHLRAWIKPALAWGVFTLLLIFMMHCINTLIRKQWVQQERLAFPIIQLPVAMTRSETFFKSRLLWLGFAIVALIDFMSGLHILVPRVPAINVKLYNISRFFTEKPWNAMGTTQTSFYPFMIGIGFFLPLDLSFSCWFFFVFRQLLRVVSSYIGFHSMPSFPYFHEQSAGAWIGLFIIAIWLSRRHLLVVFASAFGRRGKRSDGDTAPPPESPHPPFQRGSKEAVHLYKRGEFSDEPMSYRIAVLGLLVSMSALMLFCHQAGMSIVYAWSFFALYFMIAIAITRLRAEFGAPHGIFNHPLDMMVTSLGTNAIGAQNLTTMSFFFWFNRGYRPHPMPNQLEALKIAEAARMDSRRLFVAMMLAAVAAIIATFWVDLSLIYREGATSRLGAFRLWVGSGAFNRLQQWLYYPKGPDFLRVSFMGVGMCIVFLLRILRTRFLFWPFHPAGYALAVSFAIDYFWFPLFLSWLLKSLILSYGKIKGYQKAIPFFLGLILGDFVVGGLWMIFGVITRRQVYMFFI
jgi:hypothetical protein